MSSALARPLLHTVHSVTFLALLATGLLLFMPGLRAAVTGGYSLVISEAHRWGGVAFVALPGLVILRYGVRAVFAAPEQRTLRSSWQGAHVAVMVLLSCVFAFTGFVLWAQDRFPELLVEGSFATHEWLTYAAIAFLALHLVDVGVTAFVARIRTVRADAAER